MDKPLPLPLPLWKDTFTITALYESCCSRKFMKVLVIRDESGIVIKYKDRSCYIRHTCELEKEFAKISCKRVFLSKVKVHMDMSLETFLDTLKAGVVGNMSVKSEYLTEIAEQQKKRLEQELYEKAIRDLKRAQDEENEATRSEEGLIRPIPTWAETWILIPRYESYSGTMLLWGTSVLLTRRATGITIGWYVDERPKSQIINTVCDLRLLGERYSIPLLRGCSPGHRVSLYLDYKTFLTTLINSGFLCFNMHNIIHNELKRRQAVREKDQIPSLDRGFSFSSALRFDVEIRRDEFQCRVGSPMFTDLVAIDIAIGRGKDQDKVYYLNKRQKEEEERREALIRQQRLTGSSDYIHPYLLVYQ